MEDVTQAPAPDPLTLRDRLLAATRQLPRTPSHPLRAETIRIGLLLLFCCGLRRGELLRLRLGDFEDGETVLRIRLTKFYKSRLVPLSPSVSSSREREPPPGPIDSPPPPVSTIDISAAVSIDDVSSGQELFDVSMYNSTLANG